MTQEWQQQEGVVLWHGRHEEQGTIMHLLTQEKGIVHLCFRQGSRSKLPKIDALLKGTFTYREGKSSLKSLREWQPLDYFDEIRSSYTSLEQALGMIQALRKLVEPDFPVPDLYRLLLYFWKQLPLFEAPKLLTASFYLRLLRHESLLQLPFRCQECQLQLVSVHLEGHNAFCVEHAPPGAVVLDEEATLQWEILALSRDLELLKQLQLSDEQLQHIAQFFESYLR